MKRVRRKKAFNVDYQKKTVRASLIDSKTSAEDWDAKELRTRAAYFLLNGTPEFSVNATQDGRYMLLAAERDFQAAKSMGVSEFEVRVYEFNDKNAESFSLIEKLKAENLGAMEEAYLMKALVKEHGFTQDDVAALIGRSRPAVANTLRLLTLHPEVVGLVESGQLSAGHARTLVRVPQAQQLGFAQSAIKRGYSVREMERAVKAFLTPPEILQKQKEVQAAAKSEELKAFVERMRRVYRTKVSLIGNDKKGRIYIDYYTPEDLYRFEEFLDMIESFDRD